MTDVSQEWQVICDGMRGRGRHLLETGLWSDCELLVGAGEAKTSFRIHRMILAMASLVFAAEFFEGQEHTSLFDVDPDVFRQLLRYIYTDECRVDSVEAACKLASLAYRFAVLAPIKVCVLFLNSRIEVENVLQILETAEIIKNSELSNKALRLICQDTKRVLAHPSLLNVKVETLSMIFGQIVLGIDSEMELVSAAHKYAEAHPTCSMRNAVRYIRFLNLSIQEFSEALAAPSLLTLEESNTIFRKKASPNADVVMPQGFSTINTSRIKVARIGADDIEPEESIETVYHRYLERIGYEKMTEVLKTQETKNKLEYQKSLSNFETERSVLKAKFDSLETDNIKLKNTIKIFESEQSVMKTKNETDNIRLKKLETENTSMKSSIDSLETDKSRLNKIITNLKADVDSFKIKCKNKDSDMDILMKDKAVLERNIAKLNSEIDGSMPWRCTRTIGKVKNWENDNSGYYFIYFKVNVDATLVGVQLPTQVLEDSEGRQYEESVEIQIEGDNKILTPWFTKQHRVPYNSMWDISLQEPISIKKNQEYLIRVEPLVQGRYPVAASAAGQTDSAVPLQQLQQLTVTWMTDVSQEWQVICDGMRGRGRHLLETGLWSDCELLVGAGEAKTSFRIHRMILAMASLVFAAEFFEGQEHTSLFDVDPDVFRQLLRYIYTDECRVDSVEAACKLASLAYRFAVLAPIKVCVLFLNSRIEVENVLQILETAEIIKNSELSNKALRLICQDTKRVLAHPSLLNVKVETLSMIFGQIVLGIDSEMELVSAAHKYAEAHPTCSMRIAVCFIRFLNLSYQELSDAMAEPSLLTLEESVNIFRKIKSPDADVAMPQGFSTINTSRIKVARNEADNIEPEESIEIVDHRYLERIGYEKMTEVLKTQETKNKLEYQKSLSNFETERSVLKAKFDSLETDNIKLKNIIKIFESEQSVLKTKNETDNIRLKKLETENTSMKSSIDSLETDKSRLNKITTNLKADVDSFKLKCKNKDSDIDILTKDKAVLERNIAKLNSEIDGSMLWRCTRTIENVNNWENKKSEFCFIYFKVNVDVTLVGVQLPTQVLEGSEGRQYEESVTMQVQENCKVSITPWFTIHRRVPYNSMWDISLQEPINIKKNQECCIIVQLLPPGRYPLASSAVGQTDSAGPLTVKWLRAVDPRLVRGLLFEK